IFKNRKDLIELLKRLLQLRNIVAAELAIVGGRVDFAHHVENRCQSLCRIHIVFVSGPPLIARRLCKCLDLRTSSRRKTSFIKTQFEVAQTFHGISCLLEAVKGEVELLLVW